MKSDIDELFKNGKVLWENPVKVIYCMKGEEVVPLKAAFSVPKKKHKKAVSRNLLKRRMREAFRQNNNPLKENLRDKKSAMHVFFIYLSDEKLDYRQIEGKIMLLLHRLEKINEENPR